MNKQTEALMMAKQHIIERKGGRGGAVCYVKSDEDVIKAIDEALEQPAQEYLTRAQQVIRANNSAQEPVMIEDCNAARQIKEWHEKNTHPAPSWQGLSDDEINNLHHKWIMNSGNKDTQYDFARAIEQALKEKNGC